MGCLVASATMIVAWISSKSLKRENSILTIRKGVFILFISTLFLMVTMFIPLSHTNELIAYILGVFFLLVGIGISLPNCLSLALINFSKTAGTSGAVLSLGYYLIVSLCTFIIGMMHTGSLLVFPIFCSIILIIALSFIYFLKNNDMNSSQF